MYIITSTYGSIDWHDSRTIHEQLKSNGSFNIEGDKVPEIIADDIVKDFPYVDNIREKSYRLSTKSLVFGLRSKRKKGTMLGTRSIQTVESMRQMGMPIMKMKLPLMGEKRTLTRNYAYGQVSYITTHQTQPFSYSVLFSHNLFPHRLSYFLSGQPVSKIQHEKPGQSVPEPFQEERAQPPLSAA